MKLLDDINSNAVLPKWKDEIKELMETINTPADFKYLIETNNQDDLDEIERKTEKIKCIREWNFEHNWYKLKNPNLFVEFHGIKYFYDSLDHRTEENNLSLRKYEVKSETKLLVAHSYPHLSYDVIYAKSMCDAVYAAMQLTRGFPRQTKTKRMCVIITEQLTLSKPDFPSDDPKSNPLISELFIPAIIPQFALLTPNYLHYFEHLIPTLSTIITSPPLKVDPHFFKLNLVSALGTAANPFQTLNNFLKISNIFHKVDEELKE